MNGACTYACENGRVDVNGDFASGPDGDGCECVITEGGTEICDGLDNDCDGLVDNGDSAPDGCQPVEGATVTICDEGSCTYACVSGRVDFNEDLDQGSDGDGCECVVSNEVCDGMDNDCDGAIDEGALVDRCPIWEGVCFGTYGAC
ncbi:MAG: MopE-related protein, partial [Myxococcota bacterium]